MMKCLDGASFPFAQMYKEDFCIFCILQGCDSLLYIISTV